MRIAIDIRTINKPKSGVGYYVTNLIREFQGLDGKNDYCLISNNGDFEEEFGENPKFSHYKTKISNENHLVGDLWENTILPWNLQKLGVEIFHGPAFMIPLIKGKLKTVATIHDIVSYVMPETIPMKYAWYMRHLIKAVANKSDRIISDSESNKDDLMKWLNVPEKKIAVVPLAVSDRFAPPANREQVKTDVMKRYGIRENFMLFVGNLEPRKNLIRLMRAFEKARGKLGSGYQLVICGKRGWLYKEILETFEQVNESGSVILTDYVSEVELLELYQSADMFVFPTLYEGFGLPVLEAMACGAPVITSDVSSLPEIAGAAALTVNPNDTDQIANAIIRLAGSTELRGELREKGIKRAALYSWAKTARATQEVYESV